MMNACSRCDKLFDHDGFFEHGEKTLFLCPCGVFLDQDNQVVPSILVNRFGLKGQRGLFVSRGARLLDSRWKRFVHRVKLIFLDVYGDPPVKPISVPVDETEED